MVDIDSDKQSFEIDKKYNLAIMIDKDKKKSTHNSIEIDYTHQVDSRRDFEIYDY